MVRNIERKLILCACGCGQELEQFNKWGYKHKYIHGHNMRGKLGSIHPQWDGGEFTHVRGYVFVYAPYHHFTNARGYVRKHRIVWEEHNKACLLRWAVIHHKNGIRTDNSIENLEAIGNHLTHMILHHRKKKG